MIRSFNLRIFMIFWVVLCVIVAAHHFIFYPLMAEILDINIIPEQGLIRGALPGDNQTYYLIADKIFNSKMSFGDKLFPIGKDPNYFIGLIFSQFLYYFSGHSLLFFSWFVNTPLMALGLVQIYFVAKQFKIPDRTLYILMFILVFVPFNFYSVTQINKDIFTFVFFALNLNTIFKINSSGSFPSLNISLICIFAFVLFAVRPYQLTLFSVSWLLLSFLFLIRTKSILCAVKPIFVSGLLILVYFLAAHFIGADPRVNEMDGLSSEVTTYPVDVLGKRSQNQNHSIGQTDGISQKESIGQTEGISQKESIGQRENISNNDVTTHTDNGMAKDSITLELVIDNLILKLNGYRQHFINSTPVAAMIIDRDLRFNSLADLVVYFPKAIKNLLIEPNPFRLLGDKKGYVNPVLKWFYLPWMLYLYILLIKMITMNIRNMHSYEALLLSFFIFSTLLPYAYFIPNLGTVARYSSPMIFYLASVLAFSQVNSR